MLLMRTLTISMAMFNSNVNVYQRVIQVNIHLERYWILFFMVSNIFTADLEIQPHLNPTNHTINHKKNIVFSGLIIPQS